MSGGRQREFDKRQALDKAMQVFWKKGFVGASLADLTASMGINKPSLYAAFGNKEHLFIQATEHYIENYAKQHVRFLEEEGKPLKERLKAYLMSAVTAQSDTKGPKGCYISLCVSESASESIPADALAVIEHARDLSERYLTDFFTAEISKNNLPDTADPAALALFIVTLLHGTAALARGGKTLDALESVLDAAILALGL